MPEAHVNMYGGAPLNRLSWLRPSQAFLNAVVALPNTKWLLFNSGQPLMASHGMGKTSQPVYLTTEDVKPLLGPEPYFGQGKEPGQLIVEKELEDVDSHSQSPTEGARVRGIRVVFLGLHEEKDNNGSALPSSEFIDPEEAVKKIEGTLYFSMDVAEFESPYRLHDILKQTGPGREGLFLGWSEPRALMSTLDAFNAGIFASARSLADWNQRNKFCPGCGSPTYSMWGGWKISCTSLLPWADRKNRKPCPTAKGLHNFTHPRTDPVVIMIAIDETGDKVLLGRGKKYPGKFYSALAGFIEPAESFEDAVAREMWEEAGVRAWNIKYHSGQPWPYPANLMVGFYARADSSKPIRIDLDNELVDARWFTREEIISVLNHKSGTRFRRADHQKMTETIEGRSSVLSPNQPPEPEPSNLDDPPFRLPPTSAIAGVLIRDWVDKKIGFFREEETIQKGNL